MALKQIKNKIISTQKTGKVTKAMEAVSAVKMRKTQERALKSRPYVVTALGILTRLADSRGTLSHRFLEYQADASEKTLLVIVTSDKGLAGSVNSAVLKRAEEYMHTKNVDVIAVGKKAVEFAERSNAEIIARYTNISDDVTIDDVYAMSAIVMDTFAAGAYQTVSVVYQNFVSTFEQTPQLRQLLPLNTVELAHVAEAIRPKTGRYSKEEERVDVGAVSYTIEPSAEEVLDTLIPQLTEIMLYHALIESKASEHSARMVAMKNATDKSKEVTKALTLEYNKERQSEITAEVSEITGGIEALKT